MCFCNCQHERRYGENGGECAFPGQGERPCRAAERAQEEYRARRDRLVARMGEARRAVKASMKRFEDAHAALKEHMASWPGDDVAL